VAADAGNIDIHAKVVGFDPDVPNSEQSSSITATSQRGISDTEFISPQETDIIGSVVQLPDVDPEVRLTLEPLCHLQAAGSVSSFISSGRGGGPTQPGGWEPVLPLDLNPARGR
jgi:hypothetical protein